MSNINVANQTLDAIEMIVENAISRAKFDRTIQATIKRCENIATGKYIVQYQNGRFEAFSDGNESYSNGTMVYVLVPENDFEMRKTILGTVDRLGENFGENQESGLINYEYVGNNIVSHRSGLNTFGLNSYLVSDGEILYDYDNNINLINIDTQGAEIYLKNSNFLNIAAHFRTNLVETHRLNGDFGLIYTLTFIDPLTENNVDRDFILNIDQMSRDPYNQNIATRQYCVFDIDAENFVRIKKIRTFSKGFVTTSVTGKEDDIFISAIELEGAMRIQKDEDTGCTLSLITKEGLYFDENDSASAIRSIEAEVSKNGIMQNPNSADIEYYWFKENNNIFYNSPEYLKYGGQGWECLNDYTTVEGESRRYYKTANFKYNLLKNVVSAKELKIKCVAVYNKNIVLQKEITFYNKSSNYDVTITSSIGEIFGLEHITTLTCGVTGATAGHTLSYSWLRKVDDNTNYEPLDITTSTIANIDLSFAVKYVTYKCTVIDTNDNTILGTAKITLKRYAGDDFGYYHIVMNNANQMFKYDVDGISPALDIENPLTILPLTFVLYDENGNEIEPSTIGASNIEWAVPKYNTMIIITGETATSEDNEYTYYNTESLNFTIRKDYKANYLNNNIKLSVSYDNKVIKETSNLLFIKEGDIGTNGTKYTCRIVPNIIAESAPDKIIYTYYTNTDSSHISGLNYNYVGKPFKTLLFENGDLIYDSSEGAHTITIDSLSYSIQKNNYGNTIYDDTNFSINEDGSNFTCISNPIIGHDADIIKAEISYNGMKYYATESINFIKIYDNNTECLLGGGFDKVVYNNGGILPAYDNTEPFAIKFLYNEEDLSENNNTTYDWSVKGRIYLSDWQIENNLINKTKSSQKKFEHTYIPIEKFDGYCVSNAIVCQIKLSGSLKAEIHMPVQMYLNRYGNAGLNDWDGNSITTNEDEGIILAPQVGAGHKDENNAFTGLVMGDVRQSGHSNIETGLYAYNAGVRTIELNAEDGSAKFGRADQGQIIIDPTENGHAVLRSSNFDTTSNTGLEIDLTDPHIKYGNGSKFNIDNQGNVTATGLTIGSSQVSGLNTKLNELDNDISGLDTSVLDLESSINYLNVELTSNFLSIVCNSEKYPSTSGTYNITYSSKYKGIDVNVTATTSSSAEGIEIDTFEPGIISFSVDSSEAILNLVNSFTILFTYTPIAGTTFTTSRVITIALAVQGKDGSSVSIKGTYANLNALIHAVETGTIHPIIGDGYILDDNGQGIGGHLFILSTGTGTSSSNWTDVGQIKGSDGNGVSNIAYLYGVNNSASSAPSSFPYTTAAEAQSHLSQTQRYLWQKETITYTKTDPKITTFLLTVLALNGTNGTDGRGVKTVTPLHYLKSTSGAPATPTTHASIQSSTNPNVWTTAVPVYISGYTYYTCSEITYDDNPLVDPTSYEWTTVVVDNGVNTAISAATNASSIVNNMELGGRNFVLNSTHGQSDESISQYLTATYTLSENVVAGETYTFSIKADYEGKKGIALYFGGATYIAGQWITDPTDLKSGRVYSMQFVATEDHADYNTINIYCSNNAGAQGTTIVTGTCVIDWIKLEKGNLTSDWTPAPEDVDKTILSSTPYYTATETNVSPEWNIEEWALNIDATMDKYIWSCNYITYKDGTDDHTTITCLYTPSPKLLESKTQYFIHTSGTVEPGSSTDWMDTRPVWDETYDIEGAKKYLWVRTQYTYSNLDHVEYSTAYCDTTWDNIGALQRSINTNAQEVASAINNGSVKIHDGVIEIIKDPTNAIMFSSSGISFKLNGEYTSVWDIDGTFNAQLIEVKKLRADSILSGTLTLQAASDASNGQLVLKNAAGNEIAKIDVNGLVVTAKDGSSIKLKTGEQESGQYGVYLYDATGTEFVSTNTSNGTFIATKIQVTQQQDFGTTIRIIPITNGIGFIGL